MSQREGVTTTIDDKEYTMYMLPPMASHDLLVDVVGMVGPALGPALDALFTGDNAGDFESVMDQEVGVEFFTRAIGTLSKDLDKEVLRKVISEFKKVTFVGGVELSKIFDVHFQGDLKNMYAWIGWGMYVQWGKSFSDLGPIVRARVAEAQKNRKSSSPDISPGSNGD